MAETARYLGEKIKNKTVVLTGSMIPFIDPNSDAMFNLGSDVEKDLETGTFIEVKED